MMANPKEPYPDPIIDGRKTIVWTPERLEWWAKSQALGIQYYRGPFKPMYCPRREDQWVGDDLD